METRERDHGEYKCRWEWDNGVCTLVVWRPMETDGVAMYRTVWNRSRVILSDVENTMKNLLCEFLNEVSGGV